MNTEALARKRDFAALTILVLNVCDVLITQHLLRARVAHEGNALLAGVIMSPWVWLPKVGIPLAVLAAGHKSPPTRRSLYGLLLVEAVYWLVICWNVHVLFV